MAPDISFTLHFLSKKWIYICKLSLTWLDPGPEKPFLPSLSRHLHTNV